jgi:hypothetical protein
MDEAALAGWAAHEFGAAELGDARRTARLVALAGALGASPAATRPEACGDPAALQAAYRFFDADGVPPAALLAGHVRATYARLAAVPLVLAAQDATLLDWAHHPATTGLGPLGSARQRGLLGHRTLALTPERVPLGLVAQQVWARDAATFGQLPDQHTRGIAAKERQERRTSLAAVVAARAARPQPHFVSVGDREADVDDLFAAERPAGVDLLARATQDRGSADPDHRHAAPPPARRAAGAGRRADGARARGDAAPAPAAGRGGGGLAARAGLGGVGAGGGPPTGAGAGRLAAAADGAGRRHGRGAGAAGLVRVPLG